MAEGALNQSLVLHVDDDGEREAIGSTPGPAGVAEIELSPGELTCPSTTPSRPRCARSARRRAADPRVIAALIGDEAMSIVMSTPPTERPVAHRGVRARSVQATIPRS